MPAHTNLYFVLVKLHGWHWCRKNVSHGSCCWRVLEFEVLQISNTKLCIRYHLGPESSTACRLSVESTIHSDVRCGIKSMSWLRTNSTFCHSSHRSARPSPSSMRTTSPIFGRSIGDPCVHKSATYTHTKKMHNNKVNKIANHSCKIPKNYSNYIPLSLMHVIINGHSR